MQIDMDKLVELGDRLKGKRREKGQEREEIAIKIKVSPKTLHALEEAIPDSLPQPIFAKGFARSYAEALGFKTDEAAVLINAAFPMKFTDNVNPELSSAAREQSICINQTSNAKIMVVVVPVLLIIVAVTGWFVLKAFTSSNNDIPQPHQSRQAAVVPPVPGVAPPSQASATSAESNPAPEPTPVSEPVSVDHPALNVAESEAQPVHPLVDFPPNQVSQSNARADSPIPSGTKRVVLFAKYECWVGAEFDEIGRRSFTLEAGQTFVLDFKDRLVLTLGNARAIDMSYNGRPYDIGGRFREAKVLNFPPR